MVPLQVIPESLLGFGVLAFMLIALLAFFGAIVYTEHRKEMKLIEVGAYEQVREDNRAWILALGLILLALGLADIIEAGLRGVLPDNGVALALLGVAALVYYYLKRREGRARSGREKGHQTD